jgi:hypothetical protein
VKLFKNIFRGPKTLFVLKVNIKKYIYNLGEFLTISYNFTYFWVIFIVFLLLCSGVIKTKIWAS